MRLRGYFDPELIELNLDSTSKDDVLKELASMLELTEKSEAMLVRMLMKRQEIGSTGIGRGIALVYSRLLGFSEVRIGFGRQREGIDFKAIDGKPVFYFFLMVGPPIDVPSEYLPVMGAWAQFAKEPDVPDLLANVKTPEEFLRLIEAKDIQRS